MRPAAFPTIRLAQLAMLVHRSDHLFSRILSSKTVKQVQEIFMVTANDYWHYHYMLDEVSAYKEKKLGKQMVNNIMINTIIPMLFAYGAYQQENKYKERRRRRKHTKIHR